MTQSLRDAAQALLDKLDGRRSFGVELLAAEFADERLALRSALAAPDRAQPSGDAALPVVANLSHGGEVVALVEQRKHLAATAALQADLVEERNRIAGMRVEWAAEVAALQAEGAKSERRAIEFGDALHRHILAMRAALADCHRLGPHHGMHWIVNTLAGPGHLPDADDVALGGQALFDKEVAEHDAFRAAHPGPVVVAVGTAETGAEAMRSRDARIAELEAKLNTPQLHNFAEAVVLEAAHQRERWGVSHDVGKEPSDWFWLVGYLAGKALHAATSGNQEKVAHHTISTAAALANWHAHVTGEYTGFRPGIDPVARGIEPSASNSVGAAAQPLRDAVQLPDLLAASETAEPSGDTP